MKICMFAAVVTILCIQTDTGLALAQTETDLECAAVFSCDELGNVVAPFNQGRCASIYASQCREEKFNQISDQLISCDGDLAQLIEENRALIRRLTKLTRQQRNIKPTNSK